MNGAMALILGVTAILAVTIAAAYQNGSALNDPYQSEPAMIFVSGTEYWSSSGAGITEKASTIIRLADYKGDPYTVDSCRATIFYPDKTAYVDALMNRSSVPGNWYLDVPVPAQEGNYEQYVVCFYGSRNTSTSKSFHVNPALNYLKTLGRDTLEVGTNLTDVNLTLNAKVDNATATLNARVDTAETNLDGLMDSINASLSSQLAGAETNMDAKMTNVNVDIRAAIADSNYSILTRINTSETNLNSLVNAAYADILAQLRNANASMLAKLMAVNASVTASVEGATATITARIDSAETNLNMLINNVDSELSGQLTDAEAALGSTLRDVNATLYAKVGSTGDIIQTQISSVNMSLTQLINAMHGDVSDYLSLYLPVINQTVTNIYSDTQWIAANAIAHDSEMDARFNSVDGNLSVIEDFCDSTQTNSSGLCREVYSLRGVTDAMRAEQNAVLDTVDATTTNTWNLLSGQISTNIDTLLADVGIIKSTARDINDTVTDIRQTQLDQISVNIIS